MIYHVAALFSASLTGAFVALTLRSALASLWEERERKEKEDRRERRRLNRQRARQARAAEKRYQASLDYLEAF